MTYIVIVGDKSYRVDLDDKGNAVQVCMMRSGCWRLLWSFHVYERGRKGRVVMSAIKVAYSAKLADDALDVTS